MPVQCSVLCDDPVFCVGNVTDMQEIVGGQKLTFRSRRYILFFLHQASPVSRSLHSGIVYLHRESKKGCHPNHGYNFVNS